MTSIDNRKYVKIEGTNLWVKPCEVYEAAKEVQRRHKSAEELWKHEWESEFAFIEDPVAFMTHRLSRF